VVQIFGSNSDITRDRQMEEELRNLAAGLQPGCSRPACARMNFSPRWPMNRATRSHRSGTACK